MVEEKFFKVFDIEPMILKGEYYITDSCRFGTVQATEDISWKITDSTILALEEFLGTYTLMRQPSHQDALLYCYKTAQNIGKYCLTRKDALLEYFIEYAEQYKAVLQNYFKRERVFNNPLDNADVVVVNENGERIL